MFLEQIRDFFKELFASLKRILSSRVVPFTILAIVLFFLLIYRLFILQIVQGGSITSITTMKMQRTIYSTGTRGNIYDCNGKLLAYSELSYNVVISDSGYYSSTKVRNKTLNAILSKAIDIIEDHGDTVDYNFHIRMDNHGKLYYDVSDNALLRFLRDVYGHNSISQLKDEEREATAMDTAKYLAARYGIEMNDYPLHKLLEIIYIRYNMSSNLYQRYITFTIASDISQETMASILENSSEMNGVSIEEGSIRHYNYSVCMAHILGYTGRISESELEELLLLDDSYDSNDVIGKSGIESEYELQLSGTKGYKKVLIDSVGRIQKVIEEVKPEPGQDVYLTIDADYQQEIYDLLERRLSEILVTNIVNSDSTYNEVSGMITIPIVDVYNALIANNLIDMKEIAASDTPAAKSVYVTFSDKKNAVLDSIYSELSQGHPYSSLSKNMKSYIKEMRSLLISNDILNTSKIVATDPLAQQWSSGDISFRAYIEGAIHNDWINIYNLDVPSEYPSYDEVFDAIFTQIIDLITKDQEFDKLIYEDLILNKVISGKNICLILMEQNRIDYTDSEYVAIQNGGSTYAFLKKKILNMDITPAQLALDPCSGSVVVENPNNGRLIAMVTYPSYDTNYFSGTVDASYYASLLNDKSSPLLNRATQTKLAPGSTFKPLMTIAGLAEGVISSDTVIECTSIFDKVTPNIKCHVYPNNHGEEDIYHALRDSCNIYFCEVGYRLASKQTGTLNHENGLNLIRRYADILGLTTKTGIQLPETSPQVSDYNAIASSIGQGTHAYTSLNMARYLSTIANRGTVYNSSIVLKTSDSDGTNQKNVEPSVYTSTEIAPQIWNTLQTGMKEAVDSYFKYLNQNLPVNVYGKSGTAQEDKNRGNHAVFMMYTIDANYQPDIAVVTMLPYAYAATNAGIMDYYALSAYYKIDIPEYIGFDNYNLIYDYSSYLQ